MRRNLPFVFTLATLIACGPAKSTGNTDAGQIPVPPTLTTDPANGAMNVPVTIPAITVTSNEPLSPASVSIENVTLSDSMGNVVTVTTTLSASGLVATIGLPAMGLQGDTNYSLYVNGFTTTAAFGSLEQTMQLETSFTTAGAAPAIVATTPGNNSNGVGTDVQPTLTFTEIVTDTTPSSITILAPMLGTPPMSSPVTATVTIGSDGRTATIVPTQATCQDGKTHPVLCENTEYEIMIGTGLKNAEGVGFTGAPLTAVKFTTENIPPQVASVTPADMTTGVAADIQPQIVFSQPMDPATINSTPSSIPTITLTDASGTAVPATVTLGTDAVTATIVPSMPIALGEDYLITITTGVEDYSDLPLLQMDVTRFSTSAATPTVAMITPANMATGVSSTVQIVATFSEAVTNVTTTTFTLTQSGTAVPCTVIAGNLPTIWNLIPNAQLMLTTAYTINVTSGVTSTGTPAVALTPFSSTFTTGSM